MEGTTVQPPPALTPFAWAPGWNSIQSTNAFQQEIGGPLRGGDPGVRLLAPGDAAGAVFFPAPARPFSPPAEGLLLVASHHIFGSEELSVLAPAVAARVPEPCLALSAEDAHRIGAVEGGRVVVETAGRTLTLPARIEPSLPAGVGLVPAGLPGVPWLDLPAAGTVTVEG